MTRLTRALRRLRRHPAAGNAAARAVALAALAAATIVVARTSGPQGVGMYTLLRVLSGTLPVLMSCGLPGAVPFFLAGTHRDDSRLATTVIAMTGAASVAAGALWLVSAALLQRAFFDPLSVGLVTVAAAAAATQLPVSVGKTALQATDMRACNIVVALEEVSFLPAYGTLLLFGARGMSAIIAAMVIAHLVTAASAWALLLRRGFLVGAGRPDRRLARTIAGYGLRGHAGSLLSFLNLRLDFAILGVLAGPAVVGAYAVASKVAEVLRVPSLAMTYVLYPRFAAADDADALRDARALLPRAVALVAAGALPLALAAVFVLPLAYGEAFRPAVVPALILILGLSLEGAAAVATALLYGNGHPGLNSLAMALGLVVTVLLDFALIPRFGAVGAAAASTVAYVVSTATLLVMFGRLQRRLTPPEAPVAVAAA